MSEQRKWKRIRERLALHLPVQVRCRETRAFEWTELTRLHNVTPFGAGFSLKRPTEKGRLLHMTIPMPRPLRVFDHTEDQYRIWAIVRYVKSPLRDKYTMFDVGVAFIGKRAPLSYEKEPSKRYEVLTDAYDSLTTGAETVTPITEQRAHDRYNIAVDMRLEVTDANGNVIESEQSVTENISVSGATIFTTLQIEPGRFIRLTSEQQRVITYAAIRARTTGDDGVPRIHVEFLDREWPL